MEKILIIGGANQHVKYVESAHSLGLHVIVTDYLPIDKSPAKQIAEEHWEYNITDIDSIVSRCRKEKVKAVIAGHLDPCQLPYAQICSELELPCYATLEQFSSFTNKIAFKELCRKNKIGIIPDFTEDDILSGKIEFPLFVKPSDSRGSRGQTICNSVTETVSAIKLAKSESSDGRIIIEKYFGDFDEIQITYYVINDEVFLIRTVDSYRGSIQNKLNRVVSCSISPSIYTDLYLKKVHQQMVKMIKNLGIHNGPVFAQGFCDGKNFYFFDPGLRFPGVDYELVYRTVFGVDFPKCMIQFSLTGKMPTINLPVDSYYLNGKIAAILFPVIKNGKIGSITGLEDFENTDGIVCCSKRYNVGDEVAWFANVNQRFAEVDILADNILELKGKIIKFQNMVHVFDLDGKDMLFDPFNPNKIKQI